MFVCLFVYDLLFYKFMNTSYNGLNLCHGHNDDGVLVSKQILVEIFLLFPFWSNFHYEVILAWKINAISSSTFLFFTFSFKDNN